jgi:hypothetical protein
MITRRPRCQILEPNGAKLTSAVCRIGPSPEGWTAVLFGFDAPGLVVQRCLLARVREIWIRVDGGVVCPGLIKRTYFDPELGRACRICLEPSAAMLLARSLADPVSTSVPAGPVKAASPAWQNSAA